MAWRYVPGYFTHHLWAQLFSHAPSNYYRPIFLLWLRVNVWLYGLRPWAWHLTSVLAHLAVTWLVYALARRLFEDRTSALAAMLVFGLHPIHLETVAWISDIDDSLAAIAVLGALLCYIKWRDGAGKRWLAGGLALYAAGVLTKETAVVLPAFVVAWEFLFGTERAQQTTLKGIVRRAIAATLAAWTFIAVTAAYLAVRFAVLHHLAHIFTPMPLKVLLATIPEMLAFYAGKLVWPAGLSEFYGLSYVVHPGWRTFGLPLLITAAVALALIAWSWRSARVAFASIVLFLPIALVLDVQVFPGGDFVHDRYLYLPSAGFAILVAEAFRHLPLDRISARRAPFARAAILSVAAVVLAWGTIGQSTIWANDLLLGTQGVKVAPRNVRAINELASILVEKGYYRRAIRLQKQAIALRPGAWASHYSLAMACYDLHDYVRARRYIEEAIRISPTDSREYLLLAAIEFAEHDLPAAETQVRRAIQLEPSDPGGYEALGRVFAAEGNYAGAIREFQIAIEEDPNKRSARELLKLATAREQASKPAVKNK